MLVMPRGYLAGFSALCRRHGVWLIADEVATGFGRTGQMWAVDRENVKPDFLCLAKSITGGYLPLAATLTTEKIYRSFLGRHEDFKAFYHGHSYTANPLACAAALANLRLLDSPGFWRGARAKAAALNGALRDLRHRPWVGQVRQAGLMAGIELVADKATGARFPPERRPARLVCLAARREGIWLRPLGDTIVLMPPPGIPAGEMKRLLRGLRRAMETAARGGKFIEMPALRG
jgi:adenosylmethionine-8-amino-7-oxononanoate aminotransferase